MALHSAIDCTANVAVRFVQGIAYSVQTGQSLNLNATFTELECATNAAGDTIRAAVVLALNIFIDFIDLIPIAMMTDESIADEFVQIGIPRAHLQAMRMKVIQGQSTDLEMVDLMIASMDPNNILTAQSTNLSTILGLSNLLLIAEAPWSRVFTEFLNGALSAVNMTWDLTLLSTEYTGSLADIKFFQFGFLADHFRAASDALGLTTNALFGPLVVAVGGNNATINDVVGDIPKIVIGAQQIVLELFINAIFTWAYINTGTGPDPIFSGNPNPFEFLPLYCTANNTAAVANYQLFYNHSAAIAILFGIFTT